MTPESVIDTVKTSGLRGRGGAGFPTYAKLNENAETIILNCAECEPLLRLHRQLLEKYAQEIVDTFHLIGEAVGAKEVIIGIKKAYTRTIEALNSVIGAYPEVRLGLLDEVYPAGDEVVLIYEATGRVIRPGGLPIEEGVAVFNVETVYNVYRALEEQTPVIDKLVSVVGEVEHSITVRVPVGASIKDVVAHAGEIKVKDPAYLVGGPMMGNLQDEMSVVTKTTNAVIVLDRSHTLIQRRNRNAAIDLKRAASSCCQCETCTSLCPRHALGHPIEPHKFMRSAANKDFQDTKCISEYIFSAVPADCARIFPVPRDLRPEA